MGYKHEALPSEAVMPAMQEPGFLLKIVPHVDGSPRICELVRYYLRDLVFKGAGPDRGLSCSTRMRSRLLPNCRYVR
jgi:acetoacetate decarboxylase